MLSVIVRYSQRRHWIPEAPAGGGGAVGVFSIRDPLRSELVFSKGKPRIALMSLDTQKTSQQADLGCQGRQVKPPSNFSFPSKIRNIRKQFTKHYKWASKHTWSTKALGVITMCGFFVPPQASTLSQPAKATYSFLTLSRNTPGSSWWHRVPTETVVLGHRQITCSGAFLHFPGCSYVSYK